MPSAAELFRQALREVAAPRLITSFSRGLAASVPGRVLALRMYRPALTRAQAEGVALMLADLALRGELTQHERAWTVKSLRVALAPSPTIGLQGGNAAPVWVVQATFNSRAVTLADATAWAQAFKASGGNLEGMPGAGSWVVDSAAAGTVALPASLAATVRFTLRNDVLDEERVGRLNSELNKLAVRGWTLAGVLPTDGGYIVQATSATGRDEETARAIGRAFQYLRGVGWTLAEMTTT